MTPDQLRDWREDRNLTRMELAEVLGVHWMTVTAWERKIQGIPKMLDLALRTIEREKLLPRKPQKTTKRKAAKK